MIVYDFECFKYDWLVCILDTETRKMHTIVNDKEKLERAYNYYKSRIWVGYNSRNFDQWILKGILAGFDPYDITQWIIEKDRKGYEYSNLLSKFPVLNYDCSVGFRSLKELEAFMGNDIRETTVPFDIQRKLTKSELDEVIKYCKHDVMQTFEVFVETKSTFETMIELMKEFKLPLETISKTETQVSAIILGASKKTYDDEHDIQFSESIKLKEYVLVKDWFKESLKNKTDFTDHFDVNILDCQTRFAWGGVHGAKNQYFGDGFYVLSDINSMYPSMMIEYDLLSRSVSNRTKFRSIRDYRFELKAQGNEKEKTYKLVLNKAYGASLDKYNLMYDPRNGRSVCVNGQLALLRLIEMLPIGCEIFNINTDGIMVKLSSEDEYPKYLDVCKKWEEETGLTLGHDLIEKVFQKDVNNGMYVFKNGKIKSIGAFVKKTSRLDNHLPIVSRAVREYLLKGTPVEDTINSSNDYIDFQFITKVTNKYDCAMHNNVILYNKVYRVFASKDEKDGELSKKHKQKATFDKTSGTPEHCFIDNTDINEKAIPEKLDRQWYINLAKERIGKFLGGE